MKSINIFIAFLVIGVSIANFLYAQPMEFDWAKRAGGVSAERGNDLIMDDSGNSYIIGYFFGTASFGPYTLVSNGSSDMFIAKYDANGNVQWVRQIGGTGSDYGMSIDRDRSMNLLITGYFANSITIGLQTLTSSGSWDILIAKLDPTGAILWARKAGGINKDHGYHIAVDQNDNCFITGHFCGQASFGGITLTYAPGSTSETIFVAKYDPAGNVLWAQMAGGDDYDTGNGIATDRWNNCFVVGTFFQSVRFGTLNLTSTGSDDIFLAKYDPEGNFLWAKKAGSSDYDSGQDVDTDFSGNCFITGHFCGTAYFDTKSVTSTGSADIYIAKFSPTGDAQWVKKAGGGNYDIAYDIRTSWDARSTITGYFRETAQFGSTTLNSAGSSDVFVAQYDGAGNLQWVERAGGANYDRGYGIVADDEGHYIVTGLFNEVATFGPYSLTSAGGEDIFVARLQESATITLKKPNGGETWWVGNPYEITWESTGDIGEVRIYISNDNRASWMLITWSTDDEGKFDWTPAEKHVGTQCWIKLLSTNDLTVTDMSNNSFVIKSNIGHIAYHAKKIPDYISPPTLDGAFSDAVWNYALEDTMLYGGVPNAWRSDWTRPNDNFITYKAVWSEATNKIYVAVNVKDDIRGVFDNNVLGTDYFEPWADECLEFYFDSDRSGGYYEGGYASAQQWFVTGEGKIILDDYPNSSAYQYYSGDALKIAVQRGTAGNWTCETAFEIYDTMPTARRTLAEGATIGWDVWYDDSDNETYTGGKYDRDHQVGWFYAGPCYLYADYFGRMILDGALTTITVTAPNGGENWLIDSQQAITWTATGSSGNVKIELSRDNGVTWEVIVHTTPDDGTYNWTVTGPPSNYCKVRIADVDGHPVDTSDRVFAILQQPGWRVPVTVSGNNITFVRTFGGNINATDGFDDGLDVVAAPPGMTYYAHFAISAFPYTLDTDIRQWLAPYNTSIEWTLKITNAQNIQSMLSWNPVNLPTTGNFTLSSGSLIVNMRNQSSAVLSGNADVIIRYSKDVTVTYNFPQQGWYLISLPVTPVNNNLSVLFPSAMGAFAYNATTGSYYAVTTLEPKKGYWLLIPGATTRTISGTPLYLYIQQYIAGWHLIGSVLGTTNFTNPNDNPNGAVIAAYGYHAATGQYVPVYPPGTGQLVEKEGYWLAVLQPCALTIGGSMMQSAVLAETDISTFYKQYGAQPPLPPFIDNQQEAMPATCIVSRNYPNPFNPETTIEYSIPQSGLTQIHVYNALGQKVRTLINEYQAAGFQSVVWNGRNEQGELVSNGVYIYQITNARLVHSRKMIMLK